MRHDNTMNPNKRLLILATCNGIMAAGYAFSLPFFAIFLATKYGLPMSWVGAFLAFSMLVTAFSMGCGGEISDQIGRKKMMLLALFSRAVSMCAISLAIHLQAHYAVIMVLHVLMGMTGNLFTPAADAWIADNIKPHNRISAFGKMRIGINAGWAVGPMLGGIFTAASYPLAFVMSGLMYFIAGLLVVKFIDNSDGQITRGANFREMLAELKNRRFAKYCLYATTLGVVMAQLVVGISLFATKYRGFTPKQVGLLFSLNGLMVVALQHPAGRFLERYRITSGMVFGCMLYAAGYLVVGYSVTFPVMLAGMFIFSLGEIATTPGLSALAANIAPPGHKGRYLGMQSVTRQAGGALGIFMGGTGLEYIAPHWLQGPWVLVSSLALISGLGFHSLRKKLTRVENGMTEKKVMPETNIEA